MYGIRFYEEYETEAKKVSSNSVVAIYVNIGIFPGQNGPLWEGIAGVFAGNDPPVCTTSVSPDYLSERCKRISEKHAREIHPRLFEYLG